MSLKTYWNIRASYRTETYNCTFTSNALYDVWSDALACHQKTAPLSRQSHPSHPIQQFPLETCSTFLLPMEKMNICISFCWILLDMFDMTSSNWMPMWWLHVTLFIYSIDIVMVEHKSNFIATTKCWQARAGSAAWLLRVLRLWCCEYFE